MICQRNPFRQVRIRQDPRRLMEMKAQLSPSTECEGRHHHPLKKRERSSRSRRSPSHSCSMQPTEVSSTASWSKGSNLGSPSQTLRCIDDVILEDDDSETALTHVSAGSDALLILAFLKDQDYGIRLSEERTALTDKTIEARNLVAAFEPDGSRMASNKWIMKKHLDYEDFEMYDTKIREFADAFFKYVNSTKRNKEKIPPQRPRRDGVPLIRTPSKEKSWNPPGKDPSSPRSSWNIAVQRS